MKTLDQIAKQYGTDKSSVVHNYTERYATYFENIRSEKLKILEIGVKLGYSLKMWREYFENSEIIGIDIDDLKKYKEKRIHIEQGDQKDTRFLTHIHNTYGPFDIIIDDGSHINIDIQTSFDCLFPLLKRGGIYIVEDLHACYWDSHGGRNPIFIESLKKMIDYVNGSGKSGTGDIRNDESDTLYTKDTTTEMNWWEKNIEYIHLYRSIVFIKKYEDESKTDMFLRRTNKIRQHYINPRKIFKKIKSGVHRILKK